MRVSELRYCNILPSPLLAEMSSRKFSGITINNKSAFKEQSKWWEYEHYLDIHFGHNLTPDDITEKYPGLCSNCSECCCKDLPTHNIGMYMSQAEISKLRRKHKLEEAEYLQGNVVIKGNRFGVIKVKKDGDCHFLTDKGCSLGGDRPLWCKLWVCDKLREEKDDKNKQSNE